MSGPVGTYLLSITGRVRWLQKAMGRAFWRSIADVLDQTYEEGLAVLRAGRLSQCEDDLVDLHARDYGLPRVTPESTAALRTYLDSAFDIHQQAGNQEGLIESLGRLGYFSVTVTTWAYVKYTTGKNLFGGRVSFFWVDIDLDNGFTEAGTWDGGANWDDPGIYWDLTPPYDGAVEDIRAAIWRWKQPGTSCRFVRIRIGTEWVLIPIAEEWEYDANGNLPGTTPGISGP